MELITKEQHKFWLNKCTAQQRAARVQALVEMSLFYAREGDIDMSIRRLSQANWLRCHLELNNA